LQAVLFFFHDDRRGHRESYRQAAVRSAGALRAWFEEFDAAQFDAKIERDAKAGKLDQLARKARQDFRAGRTREL
jgi:hypothetical protein